MKMQKPDLHLLFYSGIGGLSFVGMLSVPQLKPNFAFDCLYELCLSLFVISSMIFAVFVLVHTISLEKKMDMTLALSELEKAKGNEERLKKEIALRQIQLDTELMDKKLESSSAQVITKVGTLVFVFAFFSLVLALSLSVFFLACLTAGILFLCLKKFFSSPNDEFLS